MRLALFLMSAALALAEPPADVIQFFANTAGALADNNSQVFLAAFDRNMPDYAKLHDEIEGLLAAYEVGSTIEIVNDNGDDRKRTLELDWVLSITGVTAGVTTGVTQRREIVKCRIEKQGKQWKIASLGPIEFFRYD
jgi:hypothetical protein